MAGADEPAAVGWSAGGGADGGAMALAGGADGAMGGLSSADFWCPLKIGVELAGTGR